MEKRPIIDQVNLYKGKMPVISNPRPNIQAKLMRKKEISSINMNTKKDYIKETCLSSQIH